MFDTEISAFRTYNSEPKLFTLSRWIASTVNGNNKFAKQVEQYRQTGDDSIKKSLPLATVGAICEGGRKVSDVVNKTGWIALDIDAKDNPHLDNAEAVRDAISQIVYVAYSGLSVSGNGVWALVKVEDPQKQAKYFEQLQKDFLKRGIILDSTKGKNPNDARFYSYDPDAYMTKDFKVYDRLPKEPNNEVKGQNGTLATQRFNSNYSLDDTREKVESLISKIQSQRIDITAGYENWISLGFALEDEFGESGRDYFHAISEFYSGYDRKECARQYTKCVKHRGRGISIGTFFHRCREFGITLSHQGNRYNGSQSKYEADKTEDSTKLNDKGYPAAWDDIELDEEDPEYYEATRHMINDAAPDELEELCKRDPIVQSLVNLFDGEVKTATDIKLKEPTL